MEQFELLRNVNVKRCEEVFHALDRWNPLEWAAALAGEAGETANAAKKLSRGDGCVADIASELADTIIYADLLAARLGIDLWDAITLKFNEVSKRRNSRFFLPLPDPRPSTARAQS